MAMMTGYVARGILCAAIATAALGCSTQQSAPPANATPAQPATKVDENPYIPPPIEVRRTLPIVSTDGRTGLPPLSSVASYAWSAMIALNWPASTAVNTRGAADPVKNFGQPGTPVWISMRSKVEVYPGNGSNRIPPHGVVLGPTLQPINKADNYGYGQAPQYLYQDGALAECKGQPKVPTPALISLDETTQIGNNQTFAGAAPARDPQGFNSKPQLIRYAVKMSGTVYTRAIEGQYWYASDNSPLDKASANYIKALNSGSVENPDPPYVNYAPIPPGGAQEAGIEVKSSWRPLTEAEERSGRFLTSMVRYYEQPDGPNGKSCYREAIWGMVGMHVISFSVDAPWVLWSTFEQADNILTADGKPTEDVDGVRLINIATPTTPMLSSDPNVPAPTVSAKGDYCVSPGSRLYFQENPTYGTLPSAGNICVNTRWSQPEPIFIKANQEAHATLAKYLDGTKGSSPLMYYKLVGAQPIPVNFDDRDIGFFSTETSYKSANATIETDYSLGNFTGNLVKGVPSNVVADGGKTVPYVNTRLLRFQSLSFDFSSKTMGGCAGCHGFAAQVGQDFSFALGNNVLKPEPTDAFKASSQAAFFRRP
jgi:hypothetical protein